IGGFSGHAADHPELGWRWAFDLCGLTGVAYALPLFFLLRKPEPPRVTAPKTFPGAEFGKLFGNRSYLLLVAYFTLPALAGWVVRDWGPAILKDEFNVSQGKAGVSATLYWQLAAIVGAVVGGWLADRRMKTTERGRIQVSALGMSLVTPAMLGFAYSPQTGLLWLAVA